ncbi:LysR family transcriptional regulator [Paenibacillus piri]|uniref:LysR family transcriptional regulator n=1 Tax=Paenibacillus piri TaxID=2547395 RepID=A0A4R5K800_9BACL|nr:LysR family transcriptional regulator [Paenibacillus piri]TDF91036.1 LysR family transcriptional regulator [Paenibacillus piri]
MDIHQLQCVIEIVRCGSFTKAAATLHITQPTISKTIKNLEEELGVELFFRKGKKFELTDAGRVIYEQAQGIALSFQNLSLELSGIKNYKKGHVRIGLPPMIGSSFFPSVIRKFHERYPGLSVHIVEEGSKKLESEVECGNLDVAAVLLPTNEELFDCYAFVDEKLQLIVHPGHPLAGREAVALTECAQEPFILFRKDFALHERVMSECIRCGFRPNIMYESSQWDFVSGMVAERLGISLLPQRICNALSPELVCVIPQTVPTISWRIAMIWRKEGYLSFAVREWIRFTREIFCK